MLNDKKRKITFYSLAYYFFIYAFLGWATEVIFALMKNGVLMKRGFLTGPLCPIYGFSFVFLLLILNPEKNNFFTLFVWSALITTFLELLTGTVILEVFGKRLWNYSRFPLNLNGHICLMYSLFWGFVCAFVLRYVQPFVDRLVRSIPEKAGAVFLSAAIMAAVIDFVYTVVSKL